MRELLKNIGVDSAAIGWELQESGKVKKKAPYRKTYDPKQFKAGLLNNSESESNTDNRNSGVSYVNPLGTSGRRTLG